MSKRVFLIISIDTECDKGPGWLIQRPISFRNILEGIPNGLTPVFDRYGIKPTYLLSPEVLANAECLTCFKAVNAEFGTHLHVEFVEPNAIWDANRTKGIQRDLSKEVEEAKLANLTRIFEKGFGYRPLSFRAGRFGLSPYTLSWLGRNGYRVDSSVTPFRTHYYETGAVVNFWGQLHYPYRVNSQGLIQVPVTIINPDFSQLPIWLLRLLEDRKDLKKKILGKLGYRSRAQWFRPYKSSGMKLIEIAESVIQSWPDDREPVLNMMFHSNEIIPAASPYCQTWQEVEQYLNSLDEVFAYLCRNYEICSIGLGEYASFFK